jgi:hypothetical protein
MGGTTNHIEEIKMTPKQFRQEIEQSFPSVEFHYNELTAQTYPADNSNISITYDGKCDLPWLFSGKNACHGYGANLEAAIADSAIRYQKWLDDMAKKSARTAVA